jgi:DNA polymerase-3 subunit epsilon
MGEVVCETAPYHCDDRDKNNMNRTVVVDVETTGLSVRYGGRVIEVGAVAVVNGIIEAEFETLIDTGASISYSAYRVHGISEEMLSGKPAPVDVWGYFRDFVAGAALVAHNASFDSAYIRHELNLLSFSLPNPWHCTVRLARKKLPQLPNHKLDTVYRHLFGDMPSTFQRHRALDDARMAARIWGELGGR